MEHGEQQAPQEAMPASAAPAEAAPQAPAAPAEDRAAVKRRIHELERDIKGLRDEGAEHKIRYAQAYDIDPSNLTDRDQETIRAYNEKRDALETLKQQEQSLPKHNPLRKLRNFLFGL